MCLCMETASGSKKGSKGILKTFMIYSCGLLKYTVGFCIVLLPQSYEQQRDGVTIKTLDALSAYRKQHTSQTSVQCFISFVKPWGFWLVMQGPSDKIFRALSSLLFKLLGSSLSNCFNIWNGYIKVIVDISLQWAPRVLSEIGRCLIFFLLLFQMNDWMTVSCLN